MGRSDLTQSTKKLQEIKYIRGKEENTVRINHLPKNRHGNLLESKVGQRFAKVCIYTFNRYCMLLRVWRRVSVNLEI